MFRAFEAFLRGSLIFGGLCVLPALVTPSSDKAKQDSHRAGPGACKRCNCSYYMGWATACSRPTCRHQNYEHVN